MLSNIHFERITVRDQEVLGYNFYNISYKNKQQYAHYIAKLLNLSAHKHRQKNLPSAIKFTVLCVASCALFVIMLLREMDSRDFGLETQTTPIYLSLQYLPLLED